MLSNFIKLIRISLGECDDSIPRLDTAHWRDLYSLSQQHAVTGLIYEAAIKLPIDIRPPREILLKWGVEVELIKARNTNINAVTIKVKEFLKHDNLDGCILKGQCIAQLYPNPSFRVPGDVDVWVKGSRKDIISFVLSHSKCSHVVYHHIDGLYIDDIVVEIHFTPSYMSNPFANRKLQKWINETSSRQFAHLENIGGELICAPTLAFNRVFILHHIYRHFLYEGVGLRQILDFYYVLKHGFSQKEKEETIRVYRLLNILNFAGAVMYVLREVCGLDDKHFITSPNEVYGKVLLNEILKTGNFGQPIIPDAKKENSIQRGWRILKRNWHFIKYEPHEVIWLPYFKMKNRVFFVKHYN